MRPILYKVSDNVKENGYSGLNSLLDPLQRSILDTWGIKYHHSAFSITQVAIGWKSTRPRVRRKVNQLVKLGLVERIG